MEDGLRWDYRKWRKYKKADMLTHSAVRNSRIAELYQSGTSIKELAATLDVTQNRVRQILIQKGSKAPLF